VGDKFLLIHPGSAQAPEAPPYFTLPSKELFEMSDLIDQTAGLLKDANGSMKAGLKQAKGRSECYCERRTESSPTYRAITSIGYSA
jgi:hypothetical protein